MQAAASLLPPMTVETKMLSPLAAGLRDDVAEEWEETKQHDVLFLITLRPPSDVDMEIMAQELAPGQSLTPAQRCGLVYVRGCEVVEVKDEGGRQHSGRR